MSSIIIDQTEKIAWVTLAKAPLNLLSESLLDELKSALDSISQSDAQIVILGSTADSRVFSAGLDLNDINDGDASELMSKFNDAVETLLNIPQATVAAVDGAAMGGGMQLAMACDLTVASSRAVFGLPEASLGSSAPTALALLPALVGPAMAADLILTGDAIKAERAEAMGLVSRLVSHETFSEDLRNVVSSLTQKSPRILRLLNSNLRGQRKLNMANIVAQAQKEFQTTQSEHNDLKEGISAYLEKRKPNWA